MQATSIITVRVDPELSFVPAAADGLVAAPFERAGADVVVVRGARAPPPIRAEAVVRVGEGGADWRETPVDLAVDSEELNGDGAAVVLRARARRLALRPFPNDAPAAWLEAVRTLLEADVARIVRPEDDAPELAGVLRAARKGVFRAAPAGIPGLDGVVARGLGSREGDGVLVVGVAADGAAWLARIEPLARAALDAAALKAAEQRIREVERRAADTADVLRRLISIGSHDLSNLLFAAHLGVAAVQRQAPASPAITKLGRSVSAAVNMVRRISDTGLEILDGPSPGSGRGDLSSAFARIRDQLIHDNPGRAVDGTVPDTEVAVSDLVVERLLTVILSNAVLHSEGPVQVRSELTDDAVTIEVRNSGQLPFTDLARLQPFEHRTQRTIGAGLWAARRLVQVLPGVGLEVAQEPDGVKAVLRLPIGSIADKAS